MATRARSHGSVLGLASTIALVAAGLVLASSWFFDWPQIVFAGASALGIVALAGVITVSIRESRRDGVSVRRAVGRGVVDGLRFLRDFL